MRINTLVTVIKRMITLFEDLKLKKIIYYSF